MDLGLDRKLETRFEHCYLAMPIVTLLIENEWKFSRLG